MRRHLNRAAVGPDHFAHACTESGPVPRGMLNRHLGFLPAAAFWTPALVQQPVRHLHRDGRHLKYLMRVVWPAMGQRRMPTRTLLGPHLAHGRRG